LKQSLFPSSIVASGHQDFVLLARVRAEIYRCARGEKAFNERIPSLLQDAVDFVLDPVRTARNTIAELDNVEKTFVGLKVEHNIRDFLDVPKGVRDLRIDGMDLDVKNTVGRTWMIPPETYRASEPCLLIAIADAEKKCWIGLMVARGDYLGAEAGNRDKKRSVSAAGFKNIMWLIEGQALPSSRWSAVNMQRFRELRRIKGGAKRGAQFFRENSNVRVHRSIIQSLLFDQRDYMKRLRSNGGARDILRLEGVALLSGAFDQLTLKSLSHEATRKDEWIAVRPRTALEARALKEKKLIV
jgi:hypothetical protein